MRTAAAHIKAQGFELIGIEIGEGAEEVSSATFSPRVCFVPGNEGTGLNEVVRGYVDRLVYVRQSGVGTASLNVATATGIVLYRFQQWAQFPEAEREGGKFIVDDSRAVGHRVRGFKQPTTGGERGGEQETTAPLTSPAIHTGQADGDGTTALPVVPSE